MEYGSIIWDPYTKQEITKLESIQRREARFITKDYKSREGCMTKMLNELNLPTLQSRRQKQRLIFFYKVVEGQVPAMPPDLFVKYQKSKRQIRAKKFDNCITNNIVTSSVRNNSKCIVITPSRTDQYKHSFFAQTAVDCNHLDENTVSAEKLESFKSAHADHHEVALSTRHIIAQQ
jgi:hypothetical protein